VQPLIFGRLAGSLLYGRVPGTYVTLFGRCSFATPPKVSTLSSSLPITERQLPFDPYLCERDFSVKQSEPSALLLISFVFILGP